MNPLLFALVDAVLWSWYANHYNYMRRMRGHWRRAGRPEHSRMAAFAMAKCRVDAVGEWRSLWGVL